MIKDKSKSAEEIYNEMYEKHKELYSTSKILRTLKSWKNCIYKGTISDNDFVMAESSTTALDSDNIAMIYDDYKGVMIKFIELFRQEYEKNPQNHEINIIINISNKLLREVFKEASRTSENVRKQRNEACTHDEKRQLKKYNISSQKGEGRTAVCCERNITIGNIFQFIGYETYHVSGILYSKNDEDILDSEAHAFTLIKYGKDKKKYALLDIFNGIVIRDVLPDNYDFANGFSIEYYSESLKKTFIYEVSGPLFKITDEILRIEAIIRNLSKRLEISEHMYERSLEVPEELNIVRLKEEFLSLIESIEKSNISDIFKKRYIERIETVYIKIIEDIETQVRR